MAVEIQTKIVLKPDYESVMIATPDLSEATKTIDIGIVGAATAMSLRLNGISHWT